MAVRPIDADELYRIEKLLDTDIVRQDRVALNLLEQVLYDIQHVPTLTPPNEPLTSDELREMDGQPVYVVPENEYSELGGWCVISADDSDDYSCALVPGTDCWRWRFEAYGEQWLAYRRPPEGEEVT